MNLTSFLQEKQLTVCLTGEIDHHTAAYLRHAIDASFVRMRPDRLILDFSGVTFMDSSGVGLVMGRYRQMKLLGGSLRVTDVPDNIYRIFAMSGLESLGVLR